MFYQLSITKIVYTTMAVYIQHTKIAQQVMVVTAKVSVLGVTAAVFTGGMILVTLMMLYHVLMYYPLQFLVDFVVHRSL